VTTTIEEFFNEDIKLPSPPGVALKILEAVRQEENSFDDIARIIMADPALTARILKIANSSLFGLPNPVDSLSQATSLIGTNALKNIALAFVIVQDLRDDPQGSFDLTVFWKRSITTAVAAETIMEYVGLKDTDIFVSGLLQDLGILVLNLVDPDSFTALKDEKRVNNITSSEAEKKRYGFDHAEVSDYLLSIWGLPSKMCQSIKRHHSEKKSDKCDESAIILGVADKISTIYHGMNSNALSRDVHSVLEEGYNVPLEQADELIDIVGEKSREILELFTIDPGDIKPFSQIMQEANEELGRLNLSYAQVVLELKQSKQNAEKLALELKLANDSLRELAYRDSLTGLFNIRYFNEIMVAEIERAYRYKHPLSLVLLDIDFFKKVNDTYGHPAGDFVLREVATTFTNLLRNCDIVARYGGEEFAIILPETKGSSAKILAQRVRRGIEQLEIHYESNAIPITISCGIASCDFTDTNMTISDFMKFSDQALYRAKENGRNRVEM
jgi:diguanylate cyclase (GGDEF)-like protein